MVANLSHLDFEIRGIFNCLRRSSRSNATDAVTRCVIDTGTVRERLIKEEQADYSRLPFSTIRKFGGATGCVPAVNHTGRNLE